LKYSKQAWSQLKNTTYDDFITALLNDGFVPDIFKGAKRVYRHPDRRRIVIHYHRDVIGRNTLKALLRDTGWTEDDMTRVRLIK
jgi:predicted RNA binding protein YcfA (HicA-like mRNA interferase family)